MSDHPGGSATGIRPCGEARRRTALYLAAAAAAAMALAAAGSLDQAHATSARSSANLTYVKQQIDRYTKPPRFVPPGPPINVSKVSGKLVYNVPQTDAIPFLSTINHGMEVIAKKYNIHLVSFATQGQPNQWVAGMNQAISQHAKLINLNVADPRVLQPQLAAAKRAHIPVISTQLYDPSQLGHVSPGLTAETPFPFSQAARLLADWVIWDTKGKADVVVVKNQEVISTQAMMTALTDEFHRYCGDSCKLTIINVPATDWATKIQGNVESALARDPKVNYVIPIYDPMAQFVVPAIVAAGKSHSVHVATYGGTPFALKMVEDSDIVRMNVGSSLAWIASGAMDQIMRVLTGMKPVRNENLGLRIFTKANVAETGTPPAYNKGFGSSFTNGYAKLWRHG